MACSLCLTFEYINFILFWFWSNDDTTITWQLNDYEIIIRWSESGPGSSPFYTLPQGTSVDFAVLE